MAINSIQLPDNTTQDIHDARLSSISELSIDSTPTANSNNLVKSGGVKAYVDAAIPTVPVTDVTVGGTSVVSGGTAAIPAIPTVPTIITSWPNNNSFNPNILYQISGNVTGEKSVSLPLADLDETIPNHWYIEFNTGSTAPTINWASSIVWNGGSAPTINASKHYEVSILYDTDTEFSIGTFIETEKTASS